MLVCRNHLSAILDVFDGVVDKLLDLPVLFDKSLYLLDRINYRRIVAVAELLADIDH